MRIVGVDPGSRRLGWGIVEREGSRLHHVASGTLQPKTASLLTRLVQLVQELTQLVEQHRPMHLAIETAFAGENVHSALVLGQVRGAIMVALAARGLHVYEYAPSAVKAATTGTGRADKQQVQHMVRMMLGLKQAPMGLDTSDALAIAICHAHRAPTRGHL